MVGISFYSCPMVTYNRRFLGFVGVLDSYRDEKRKKDASP